MKAPATVIIASDLHCGSRFGLIDPESEHGRQSPIQKYIWECWMWIAENWPKPDLLVLNGDVIDGEQRKSSGTGIHTSKLSEQVDIAADCLKPFLDKLKPRKIIRAEGTAYHEGFHGAVHLLDKTIGICAVTGMEPFDVELMNGRILNVKHHPEGGMALYMGTMQDRETLWATIAESRQGLPEATFIVRSHLHTHAEFKGCGKVHIQTPSFEWSTPYAQKLRYYRYQPNIGAVMLRHTDWDTKNYAVIAKTFKNPVKGVLKYEDIGKEGQA